MISHCWLELGYKLGMCIWVESKLSRNKIQTEWHLSSGLSNIQIPKVYDQPKFQGWYEGRGNLLEVFKFTLNFWVFLLVLICPVTQGSKGGKIQLSYRKDNRHEHRWQQGKWNANGNKEKICIAIGNNQIWMNNTPETWAKNIVCTAQVQTSFTVFLDNSFPFGQMYYPDWLGSLDFPSQVS